MSRKSSKVKRRKMTAAPASRPLLDWGKATRLMAAAVILVISARRVDDQKQQEGQTTPVGQDGDQQSRATTSVQGNGESFLEEKLEEDADAGDAGRSSTAEENDEQKVIEINTCGDFYAHEPPGPNEIAPLLRRPGEDVGTSYSDPLQQCARWWRDEIVGEEEDGMHSIWATRMKRRDLDTETSPSAYQGTSDILDICCGGGETSESPPRTREVKSCTEMLEYMDSTTLCGAGDFTTFNEGVAFEDEPLHYTYKDFSSFQVEDSGGVPKWVPGRRIVEKKTRRLIRENIRGKCCLYEDSAVATTRTRSTQTKQRQELRKRKMDRRAKMDKEAMMARTNAAADFQTAAGAMGSGLLNQRKSAAGPDSNSRDREAGAAASAGVDVASVENREDRIAAPQAKQGDGGVAPGRKAETSAAADGGLQPHPSRQDRQAGDGTSVTADGTAVQQPSTSTNGPTEGGGRHPATTGIKEADGAQRGDGTTGTSTASSSPDGQSAEDGGAGAGDQRKRSDNGGEPSADADGQPAEDGGAGADTAEEPGRTSEVSSGIRPQQQSVETRSAGDMPAEDKDEEHDGATDQPGEDLDHEVHDVDGPEAQGLEAPQEAKGKCC
ncbi:unnamed protein product [Amoebophrya sp. A25]|nr:unnamed protein product [Amoebophrya sp. A25]|eukprot:GSA25T00023448001.1